MDAHVMDGRPADDSRRPGIDGATELFGILGYPVTHSLSPAIYNLFFQAAGENRVYVPLQTRPAELDTVFDALRKLQFAGFNVTSPFKHAVTRHLDRLEGVAAELGCVNTISREGETWIGHNTDGEGLAGFLESLPEIELSKRDVVLLGAGNAARAIFRALLARRPGSLTVVNRSQAKFEEPFFRRHSGEPGVRYLGLEGGEPEDSIARSTLIVNATSYGLGGRQELEAPPFPGLGRLAPGTVVVDTNYCLGRQTALLERLPVGLRAYDGRGMLLHLAGEAYRIWTGHRPDLGAAARLLGVP